MRSCRPLTDSEISRLLDLLSAPAWRRERTLIILGIRKGLRLTSMLSLRIGDVSIADEVRNRIRIRRRTTKGRRAGFNMPLHPQAAAILQEYLDTLRNRSPNAYLFPGRRSGTRLHRIAGWRAVKSAFDRAGLYGASGELGTHTLRKTLARLIYSALGHDLVRTSYAMRHASVSTTVEYLSFREEEVDAAILAL